MSKIKKRYTAQEMRDVANVWEARTPLSSVPSMLRQAAECQEDFKTLGAAYKRKQLECETLKNNGAQMSDFEKMVLVAFKMGDIRGRVKYDPIQKRIMSWVPRRGANRGYWAYIDSSRFVEAFNRFFTDHKKDVLG